MDDEKNESGKNASLKRINIAAKEHTQKETKADLF